MDVSVIVCTYNRAASLGHTLKALDEQATPPALGWELLVVDNNSSMPPGMWSTPSRGRARFESTTSSSRARA